MNPITNAQDDNGNHKQWRRGCNHGTIGNKKGGNCSRRRNIHWVIGPLEVGEEEAIGNYKGVV